MKRRLRFAAMVLLGLVPDSAQAQESGYTADEKVVIPFACEFETEMGNEVFVTGNHPDLGDWNLVLARKLRWTVGNVWTGAAAIAAGHALEYKYIVRTNRDDAFCAGENVIWLGAANLSTNIPARAGAPFTGKIIYYYSGWTNAALLYRTGSDTNIWQNADLQRVGAGRFPGEHLYRAEGVGQAGELLTFVPHGYADGDPEEKWDNCPIAGIQDYFTRLDAFLLQDGNLYNYWPATNRTARVIATHEIESAYAPQAPSRSIRVYVPRNYTQNPAKRYPVLYLHDGQNVFRPGGDFGCWYAEDAADNMISLGMMRETILVAVDNTEERLKEYLPPGDSTGYGAGAADQYLAFVVNDVKPFVDGAYRTLPDRENTGVIGSSFGGLASLYFGLATNVFGKIGLMSTSFWAIPNFYGRSIVTGDTSGLRIYMDAGTSESDEDIFAPMWSAYDQFLIDGHAPNDTLRVEVGCEHPHSEWAWAERVDMPMTFLFNARDEANWIARDARPPRLNLSGPPGALSMSWTHLKGIDHVLQRSGGLQGSGWIDVATGRVENLMWGISQVSEPSGAGTAAFYRLQCRPAGE